MNDAPLAADFPLVAPCGVIVFSIVYVLTSAIMHTMGLLFVQGRDAYERLHGKGDSAGRYYGQRNTKCLNCKQKGHSGNDCPWPKVWQWPVGVMNTL